MDPALAAPAPPLDLGEAVELADRTWWVASLLPSDRFQCHAYLIEQGDQSVLIDPGSALIVDEVIRKVDAVVGLRNVRWLVCSHADPDIIGALPAMVAHGLHPEARIVTHWRDEALIVHSGISLPYWRVEDHDWRLPLPDRELSFVFTPYAHFAGAFCTFDRATGVLFSSDLFGGFSDDRTLVAESADYFDGMRAFHEHYMPSGTILTHSIEVLAELPLTLIAPQHGQVIPEELVAPIIERLRDLDCGLYLMARDDPGLRFLLGANHAIRDVIDTLTEEPRFSAVAEHVATLAGEYLGTERVELWAQASDRVLRFDADDGYTGREEEAPPDVLDAFRGVASPTGQRLVLPLRAPGSQRVGGAGVLEFAREPMLDAPTRVVLEQVASLVEVGLEREVLRRIADLDRDELYAQATHDPLTGLHNRAHLIDVGHRLCAIDDRDTSSRIALLMIDVDHFKRVNDTHGHPVGDLVLQHVARAIEQSVREGDVTVRFGGEEFVVVLSSTDPALAWRTAERIRAAIAADDRGLPIVTASVGLAMRHRGEGCDALISRADLALYRAKAAGRDRVVVA